MLLAQKSDPQLVTHVPPNSHKPAAGSHEVHVVGLEAHVTQLQSHASQEFATTTQPAIHVMHVKGEEHYAQLGIHVSFDLIVSIYVGSRHYE